MGFISQKKEKQLRLRYTVAFFLFCLFLHILNSMTLGPWWEAGHRSAPGLCLPFAPNSTQVPASRGCPTCSQPPLPSASRARLWRLPHSRGAGRAPGPSGGGPRPRPVPPTVRLMDWLSFLPRGSVPSFSPRPWSGPPLVWLAQLAGRDPLVMHLRWGVALPWNPRPTLSVQDDFLQLMERIPHVHEHSRCAFQASVLTASVSGAFVGNERMASCLLASSRELCPRP